MKYLLLLVFFTSSVFSNSGGKVGATKKNGNGCSCHGNLNSAVSVIISGPDTIKVGETKNYTVTITGGTLTAAGFNVATSSGTLTAIDGQLMSGELTHAQPKSPSAGKVTFNFSFKGVATGSATLYATANSVNLNGGESGDAWNNSLNKIVTIIPTTDVKENLFIAKDFRLNQNFPNPFNPTTEIKFYLPNNEFTSLKIFNTNGKLISTLIEKELNMGEHKIMFSAKNLSSGTYIYILNAGRKTISKKMLLLK